LRWILWITTGRAVPYFEAQHELPGSVGGLPAFFYGAFSRVDTHALFDVPVSSARKAWPVLVFSPGLSVPREQYTALCADLASRGYVVVALSTSYESAPTVLAGGRVVGQTVHPDVMGPPPHPELQRLQPFQQQPGVEGGEGRAGVAHEGLQRLLDPFALAET